MRGLEDIPPSGSSRLIPDGENVGTFGVSGSSGTPRVIGVHQYQAGGFDDPSVSGFVGNFMYPAGNLSAYGGGPIGY